MKKKVRMFFRAVFIAVGISALTGCHGSKGLEAFTMPEEFDLSREYEITFWAKMIRIKPRLQFMSRPLLILKSCIPILP